MWATHVPGRPGQAPQAASGMSCPLEARPEESREVGTSLKAQGTCAKLLSTGAIENTVGKSGLVG